MIKMAVLVSGMFVWIHPQFATAGPNDATTRASTVMNTQVSALRTADSEAALVGTFARDAVVLVPDPRLAHGETTGLREAIARLSPHDELRHIEVRKLVAGANATALWWSAELALTIDDHEPEQPASVQNIVVRVTELATAESDWKVVAAAFGEVRAPDVRADPNSLDAGTTTGADKLTPLAANVTELDRALAPQAVVFGTDKGEAAFDTTSAHKLLHGWAKLTFAINGRPREVHGKDWGFAIAAVDWQQPKEKVPARMAALLIGAPTAAGWQIVAAQYTAD